MKQSTKKMIAKTILEILRRNGLLSLLCIASSVVFAIACPDFIGPQSQMLNRCIWITVVLGGVLSGLGNLFSGAKALLVGYGFVLVLILPRALPDPWDRYFTFLCLAVLLAGVPLYRYLKQKKQAETSSRKTGKGKSKTKSRLASLRIGLLIACGVIGLPWLYLQVPYGVFSVLALLLFPAAVVISCLFPGKFRWDDSAKSSSTGVDLLMPALFSAVPLMLRTVIDFNFLEWKNYLVMVLCLTGVITAVLLCFAGLEKRTAVVLSVVFCAAVYSYGAVGQLNYLLDVQAPEKVSGTITEMEVNYSSKAPDDYYFTIHTVQGDTVKLRVSEALYHQTAVGDPMAVYTYHGGLGIPYAEVGP